MRPRARRDGLVARPVGREMLVYDLDRHHAACLSPTTAFVFRHCDGRTTVARIATLLSEELGRPLDESIVWLAVQRLEEAHLLEPGPAHRLRRLSRRQWAARAARLGLSAALLPVITSIVAPTVAQALTGIPRMACKDSDPPCPAVACLDGMGNFAGNCLVTGMMLDKCDCL